VIGDVVVVVFVERRLTFDFVAFGRGSIGSEERELVSVFQHDLVTGLYLVSVNEGSVLAVGFQVDEILRVKRHQHPNSIVSSDGFYRTLGFEGSSMAFVRKMRQCFPLTAGELTTTLQSSCLSDTLVGRERTESVQAWCLTFPTRSRLRSPPPTRTTSSKT